MLPSMALSATSTIVSNASAGSHRKTKLRLTASGTYSTGGYALTAASFGLNKLDWVDVTLVKPLTGFASVDWDRATSKILAYTSAGAEVANATADTGLVVEAVGYGS